MHYEIDVIRGRTASMVNRGKTIEERSIDPSKIGELFQKYNNTLISGDGAHFATTALLDAVVKDAIVEDENNKPTFLFIENNEPLRLGFFHMKKDMDNAPIIHTIFTNGIDRLSAEEIAFKVARREVNFLICSFCNDMHYSGVAVEDSEFYLEVLDELRMGAIDIPIICVMEQDGMRYPENDDFNEGYRKLLGWMDLKIEVTVTSADITGAFLTTKPETFGDAIIHYNGMIELIDPDTPETD